MVTTNERKQRNREICEAANKGVPLAMLAEHYGLSVHHLGQIIGKRYISRIVKRTGASTVAPPSGRKVFIADIIAHTARVFRITEDQITGRGKSDEIVFARFAVCWIARQTTGHSLPMIGSFMSGRDHSTIWHGCLQCEHMMAIWPPYARKVAIVRWLAEGGSVVPFSRPQPKRKPKPITINDGPKWWELSDDELMSQRIAQHKARGGDFVEVRA